MFASGPLRSLAMTLNGFSILLFVPAAPEVLAETKRAIYTAFCPLILRLKFSFNIIKKLHTMLQKKQALSLVFF